MEQYITPLTQNYNYASMLFYLRIPRDIQSIVYCAAVAKGSDDVFAFVKQRYDDSTTTAIQRGRLLSALGCSTDSSSLQEYDCLHMKLMFCNEKRKYVVQMIILQTVRRIYNRRLFQECK